MSTEVTSSPTRPLVLLFAVMLGLTLWFTTRSWDASIRDRHEFRQHQTALSTYWMRETGYKLDYETPLFGPPWSVPMEFPVYQWITATALGLTAGFAVGSAVVDYHTSLAALIVQGVISGLGPLGYELALHAAISSLRAGGLDAPARK